MVKKVMVPCDINGKRVSIEISIGHPAEGVHPIYFQSKVLNDSNSGRIPQEIMDSIANLYKIAQENQVDFEELVEYAFKAAQSDTQDNATSPFGVEADEEEISTDSTIENKDSEEEEE